MFTLPNPTPKTVPNVSTQNLTQLFFQIQDLIAVSSPPFSHIHTHTCKIKKKIDKLYVLRTTKISFLTNCASPCGFGVIRESDQNVFLFYTISKKLVCYMQTVLSIAMRSAHLVYTAEVFPIRMLKHLNLLSPMPGTYSGDELTEKDLTICHLRMLSVSVSVLSINSMTQRVYACECECVKESCV